MRPVAIAMATTTLTTAAVVSLAGPAAADARSEGRCSVSSTWEAEVDRDGGVHEIDVEVRSARQGERWRLTLTHQGESVYSSTRVATADRDDRYADVDWEVSRADRPGVTDVFVIGVRNIATGETCTATLRG